MQDGSLGTSVGEGPLTPAQQLLVMEGLPVACAVARAWAHKTPLVSAEDLLSMATLKTTELARTYDPSRAPWAPYLHQQIDWTLSNAVRKERRPARSRIGKAIQALRSHVSRLERSADPLAGSDVQARAAFQQKLNELGAAAGLAVVSVTPGGRVEENELSALVRDAVAALDPPLDQILRRHWFEGVPLREAAAEVGWDQDKGYREHRRALTILEKRIRARHKPNR